MMIVAAISLLLGGFATWRTQHLKHEQTQIAAKLASEQDSLKTLTQNNERIKYVVSNNGAADPASQNVVDLVTNKIAPLMCDWTSGSIYRNNRTQLQQYVNDNGFFNGKTAIMGGQMDSTNHSYIDAEHLKSTLGSANCYMMPDGSYLAVIKFYLYTKTDTLSDEQNLTPAYVAFTCRSDGHTISNVNRIDSMTLING